VSVALVGSKGGGEAAVETINHLLAIVGISRLSIGGAVGGVGVAGAFAVAGKGCVSKAVFRSWLSAVAWRMSVRSMGLLCSVVGIIGIFVVGNGIVIGGSCSGMLAAVSLSLAGKSFTIKVENHLLSHLTLC